MAQKLKFPAECMECGQVMRAGTQVQVVSSIDRNSSAKFIHERECPKPRDRIVKQVNLAPTRDADLLFWERRCVKCRTTLTGRWADQNIPALCNITTYEPHGRACGGELIDPDAENVVSWDDLPPWLQKTWRDHGVQPEEEVPAGEEQSVFLRAVAELEPDDPLERAREALRRLKGPADDE